MQTSPPLFVRDRHWRHVVACAAGALLAVVSTPRPSHAAVWINEFVAENSAGLTNAAGKAADWIELYNDAPEAVALGGWHLTDDASVPTQWRVPEGTSIASNGYLVIFADSSAVSVTNNELHANFSLSKDGEYLALVQPDGQTLADAFVPFFPAQYADVSFGHAPLVRELVGAGTPARYRVPNAAGTALWQPASGALGFSGVSGTFTVRYYEMNAAINSIDAAEAMVANSAYWKTDRSYPIVEQHGTVNFHANSSSGYFSDDVRFPGHAYIGEDRDRFVVVTDGALYVPAAGQWTFCVGSDDGFRLRISGHGVSFVSEYVNGRGFDTTLATFTFPEAGVYSLNLVFNENGGGATFEFSAAHGFHSAFSLDAFHLAGDPAGQLLHAGAIGTLIETDVGTPMTNVNARLDAAWSFVLASPPAPEDTVTLSVRCADGFAAALNGTPLAAVNVPTPLAWNSAASAPRLPEAVAQWLTYVVPASALTAGTNTLAITALNDSATNTEFLIQPRLLWSSAARVPFFFKNSTPGAANAQGYSAPTPKVSVSEPRGYKTSPFSATLSCADAAALIRYTLDGSTPGLNSPTYSAPLTIARTTTLRAAVVVPEAVRQHVTTVTWLFLEDILEQGATTPAGWPATGQVNSQVMEYGMRALTVAGDPLRLRSGMTNAIPSLSLVTDLPNLFNPQTGIYVNPGNDGIAWERPVAVELIDPVRGTNFEFRIDAGLRIRGAFSRTTGNPKHSFRLFFRSEYGEAKLKFKLFDDEGAGEFDKVDLRTSQNYSWAYENSAVETFIRETFSRDTQRDMGMPYTRSRYYHLFLNGQYWGLYQTQERGDADYAAANLGGKSDDWDCIKTTQPGYTTSAADGTFDAFYALHNLALNQGFSGAYSNNYGRARGLNPDGTANTNYPAYLDPDNLIVYMLSAYYAGDPDSPVSIWGGFPNNMYGLYRRDKPSGFKWLRHDAEHSLGAHGGYPVTCDTTYAGAAFTTQANFNPATLHQRLCDHPDYRMRFADLVQKHLYGNGALTPTNAQTRFRSRMSEIDLAIIAESARWGRGKTRDANWLPACNAVLNTYLAQRRDLITDHFRNRGWLSRLEVPRFSTNNAAVPAGHLLRVSATNAFYYTTDGSDPRLPGGGPNPAAIAVTQSLGQAFQPATLSSRGASWRYSDRGEEPAPTNNLAWRDAGYPDAAWPQGPAVLGFAGSAAVNPVATVTRRYVNGVSGAQVTTTYFRRTFTLASTEGISGLALELLRDDGAIVYLNGTEILREIMPAGTVTYATWASTTVGSPDQNTYFARSSDAARLLRVGTNVVAVELHQCNAGSSDLYFDLSLTTVVDAAQNSTYRADVPVTDDVTLNARSYNGIDWSPLAEASLTLGRPPPDYTCLRVSELMYAPPAPAQGSPYNSDDFAWLELRNTGAAALELSGVRFASGLSHTFAPFTLPAGARLVLAKNPAAFATLYPTNTLSLTAWDSGNLARKGETLSLVTPDGTNLLTFTYSNTWHPSTYNAVLSLVAVDLAAAEPLWSTSAQWRPSHTPCGSPGLPDAPRFTAASGGTGNLMRLDAEGLEGSVELWFAEDLQSWSLCPPAAWSLQGDTLTIDTQSPALPAAGRGFFQIRLRDE